MEKLKYASNDVIESLRNDVEKNIRRYRDGDFIDLMPDANWSIDLKLDVDLAPLKKLDPAGTPAAEIANSRLVWQALQKLPPSLAAEEGIWMRLTHVECLPYARQRWLDLEADDEVITKSVREHFFGETLTRRRDDNAVARLWWNAFVANLAAPGADLKALDVILQKADVRLNFVERSLTVSRPLLAGGIVRLMQEEAWVADREDNFRAFMRTLNRLGGGVVFETMSEADVDTFMLNCARRAGMPATTPASANNNGPAGNIPVAAAPSG